MSNEFINKITNENEYLDFLKEFDKEIEHNSDRGLALICASIIDQILKSLLKSFLVKTDKIDKDLFKGSQPLSGFEEKKQMAYYLGLISDNELSNITYIQRVRNKFAHEITDISFTNNDIKNICSNFEIPKNSYSPPFIPFKKKVTDEIPYVDLNPIKKDTIAKDRFIFTFNYLFMNLMSRSVSKKLGSRKVYDQIETADNVALSLINEMKEGIREYENSLDEAKQTLNIYRNLLEEKRELLGHEKFLLEEEKKLSLLQKENDLRTTNYRETKKFLESIIRTKEYTYKVIQNSMK